MTVSPVSGSTSLESRRTESPFGEPGCLRLSSSVTSQQGSFQGNGSGVSQDDPDHLRVAQYVLVLGPGQPVSSDSLCAPTTGESSDTSLQQLSSP